MSNIRLLKIIAIILGILIIIGIFFLFLGLAKSYNNLGNEQKIVNKSEIKNNIFNEFIFFPTTRCSINFIIFRK